MLAGQGRFTRTRDVPSFISQHTRLEFKSVGFCLNNEPTTRKQAFFGAPGAETNTVARIFPVTFDRLLLPRLSPENIRVTGCLPRDQDICAGRLAIRSRSCVAARQTTAPTLGRPGVSSRKFRGTSIRKSWQVCEHILYGVFSINSRLCSLRTLALGGGKFGAVG